MMSVLVAVIDDLWQFAYSNLFGSVKVTSLQQEREVQASLPLVNEVKSEPRLFSVASLPQVTDELKPGEQYFVSELDVYLYSDPVVAFDTAIEKIPYGQSVLLKKIGGRWAEVEAKERRGWMLKDALTLKKEDVRPHLIEGVEYDSHHRETIKLRACINDEFAGARADLPLLSTEYVTYRLSQLGVVINWRFDSPRLPGTWQKKLKGQKGIHMTVLPKTHSIMEYVVDDEGYLAFVEAVFPDNSIKLSQVGHEEGFYREALMSQEEYRELRPVFIEVS